jgi:hypothetical protein
MEYGKINGLKYEVAASDWAPGRSATRLDSSVEKVRQLSKARRNIDTFSQRSQA